MTVSKPRGCLTSLISNRQDRKLVVRWMIRDAMFLLTDDPMWRTKPAGQATLEVCERIGISRIGYSLGNPELLAELAVHLTGEPRWRTMLTEKNGEQRLVGTFNWYVESGRLERECRKT